MGLKLKIRLSKNEVATYLTAKITLILDALTILNAKDG